MAEHKKRFGTGLDHAEVIHLFPVVARWNQNNLTEELTWAGSKEIRESFAHELFSSWLPLLDPARDETAPVIAWHTTEGGGHCLLQVVADGDGLVATAVVLSHKDAARLQFDPFLLLYGNVLPAASASSLTAIQVSIGDLVQSAEHIIADSFNADDRLLANDACRTWAAELESNASPRVETPGPRQMVLTGLYLWPHLSTTTRAQLGIVISPRVTLADDELAPRLTVCMSENNKVIDTPNSADALQPLGAPESEATELTFQLLNELDSGVDLSTSQVMERVAVSCQATDLDSYRHVLDHLICGLEPRVSQTVPAFLLDLLRAYSPPKHLQEQDIEAGWKLFDEAMHDIVNFARVGLNEDTTRRWLAAAAKHGRRDTLIEIGLAEAMGRQLNRAQPEPVHEHLEDIIQDDLLTDLPKNDRGWLRDFVARVSFTARTIRDSEPVEAATPNDPENCDEDEADAENLPSLIATSTQERMAFMADGVQAIQSILAANHGEAVHNSVFPERTPSISMEERAIESWGLSNGTSVLMWESLAGGDAHGTLAAAVHAIRGTSSATLSAFGDSDSDSEHPVGISIHGPGASVDRLEDAIAAVGGHRERFSQQRPIQSDASALAHVNYGSAGAAVRCSALRNIWARARGARSGQLGAGASSGATFVAASGGLARWPELWSRTRGAVFVLDAKRVHSAPRSIRAEVNKHLEKWGRCETRHTQVTIILEGCDQLDHPSLAPLQQTMVRAFDQLSNQRKDALSSGLITGLSHLGLPTLNALGGQRILRIFSEYGLKPTVFPLPAASSVSTRPLHDLPMVWMLQQVGVRLNLARHAPRSPQRYAAR